MTPLTALMENPLFKPLWDAFPYLPACFSRWEGMTLGDIAASTYGTADRPGRMAASAEALDCMAALPARSLGPEAEAWRRTSFTRSIAGLSANLHGIDCLPEMVQAVHFFGLDRLASGERGTVIPVLSCGGISLQSSAYPRGMLAFPEGQPIRFPLFRSAWQDTVELNAPALTERDVRAIRPLWHVSHPYIRQGLDTVVRHMLAPETLALERFGEQATGVNARLCAERFSDSQPVVVYLELEEVARALLFRDLERPDSLLHRALFVPHLRERQPGKRFPGPIATGQSFSGVRTNADGVTLCGLRPRKGNSALRGRGSVCRSRPKPSSKPCVTASFIRACSFRT